jgi:hypothetical protein
MGVDVIHPIQALAKDMDAPNLKNHFGGCRAFCGGVDAQYLLVNGSANEVTNKVTELKKIFPTGLIISPSHEAVLPDIDPANIEKVSIGHGAGTFNLALDKALKWEDDEIVYFVENDYLHKQGSLEILKQGFELGASFVALYDHPDKYLDPSLGGNPYCEGGAEDTRVYLTDSCHWKITNSTTMTFASKVSTLKRTESTLRKHTIGSHPNDFNMFLNLREQGELLISSIPGYATHGETRWLTPLTNWETV